MEIERTQIHYLSDVFVAVAVLPYRRLGCTYTYRLQFSIDRL